ncbi:MAG: ACP S-malonyltransferase [Myxococcales bacterium]|nr:ACP S-malonyltransferase [Myxococcales bacterium]
MRAFIFPGQGSQSVGMGAALAEASPTAREAFAEVDEALGQHLFKLMTEGPEGELTLTENAQPAIMANSIATLRVLEKEGGVTLADKADFVAGHSLGEYSALVAAGALEFAAAVPLVRRRAELMQNAVPAGEGAMAAVLKSTPEAVEAACSAEREASGRIVSPANYNAPAQTVIAGHADAVAGAGARLSEAGARVKALAVSAPFHCELMAPAAEKLAPELEATAWSAPTVPVVTNVEATPNADPARIPALLRRQVTAPVRFVESVERLAALGVTRVLEIGPGRVLSGLVARIDRALERASLEGAEGLAEARAFVSAAAPVSAGQD